MSKPFEKGRERGSDGLEIEVHGVAVRGWKIAANKLAFLTSRRVRKRLPPQRYIIRHRNTLRGVDKRNMAGIEEEKFVKETGSEKQN